MTDDCDEGAAVDWASPLRRAPAGPPDRVANSHLFALILIGAVPQYHPGLNADHFPTCDRVPGAGCSHRVEGRDELPVQFSMADAVGQDALDLCIVVDDLQRRLCTLHAAAADDDPNLFVAADISQPQLQRQHQLCTLFAAAAATS